MDEKKFIRLPDSELEVMQGIWLLHAEGETLITAGIIMKRCPQLTRLKLTTVLTLISRLLVKGFITSEKKDRSNCYTPIVGYEEYRKLALDDFCKKVFLDDKAALVSAVLESSGLSDEELAKIRERATK